MDYENDRLLLARAQLNELLDALRLTSFDSSPVHFLLRLDAIRHIAAQHRFESVAEIASHFEEALQRIIAGGGNETVVRNFTEILDEAIGCSRISADVAQAMLASVAMRLRA